MSERPRRSTRAPAKVPVVLAPASSSESKRTSDDTDKGKTISRKKRKIDVDPLQILLRDPKSALTTMDIAEILNSNTWMMLSEDSRARLCQLLPRTAFHDFQPTLDHSHPSQINKDSEAMDVDSNVPRCNDLLNTDVFHDGHFLAAAHTFQDHIFSGWKSEAQVSKVAKFDQGLRDGTLHASWKDEVWEDRNAPEVAESSLLAGEAAELKMTDLVKNSLLKVGDILAYKRNFTNLHRTIEKDVLIHRIDPLTSSMTVLVQPGPNSLPQALQSYNPSDHTPPTQSITITTPSQLENVILDLEGTVGKVERPHGNAWKQMNVWRWPEGISETALSLPRGGRECHGTLFYLRGNLFYEQ